MKRWLVLGVAGLGVLLALGVARRVLRDRIFRLFERMMDACFARMPPQRREFMLAHCRGALDSVEARYVAAQPAAPTEPAEPAEVDDAAPERAEVALSARA